MGQPLKVVAQSSDRLADTLYVRDGTGDYPVMVRNMDGGMLCLIEDSRICRHVDVVADHLRRKGG